MLAQPNHGWQLCFPLYLHAGGTDLSLYDGSDIKTYLYRRGLGPDLVSVVGPTGIELLDSFYSAIQLYIYLGVAVDPALPAPGEFWRL